MTWDDDDDDWELEGDVHWYTPVETLRELAWAAYMAPPPGWPHTFGLSLFDAAYHEELDDIAAAPYVEALERALRGDNPQWT